MLFAFWIHDDLPSPPCDGVSVWPAGTPYDFALGLWLSGPVGSDTIALANVDEFERVPLSPSMAPYKAKSAEPLVTQSIYDAIYKDVVEGSAGRVIGAYQEHAWRAAEQGLHDAKKSGREDDVKLRRSRVLRDAFIAWLSPTWWHVMADKPLTPEGAIPLIPTGMTGDSYLRACMIRDDFIDNYSDGLHREVALTQLQESIDSLCRGIRHNVTDNYRHIYGRAGRNAPCGCGSGKKFKSCHATWRTPYDARWCHDMLSSI